MENFNILRLLAKYWVFIVVITTLVFGAGLLSSSKRSTSYFGSMTVTVQAVQAMPQGEQLVLQPNSGQATPGLVATAQAWVADPAYVQVILKEAGVAKGMASLKDYSQVFEVVIAVANANTFQVQYTGLSQAETEKVFQALQATLNRLATDYNKVDPADADMALTYSVPAITTQSASLPLVPFASLLAGLILSLAVVAILEQKRS